MTALFSSFSAHPESIMLLAASGKASAAELFLALGAGKPCVAYADGACSGNGKQNAPGGWGAVLVTPAGISVAQGGEASSTNNKMELTAVIAVLEALPPGAAVEVHTDSQYVVNGSTTWRKGWQGRGMRTASGGPVANADLWLRLWAAADRCKPKFTWVRGHSGNPGNEVADRLAVLGTQAVQATK